MRTYVIYLPMVLILLPLSHTKVAGQTTAYDTTYRPGRYEEIVEQFQSYPNDTADIVFLGNSITARTDWGELLQLDNAINRGISGDITYGVLQRLEEVTEGHPRKVFILIGINDISRNIPDSLILANYKKIIRRIKQESPRTRIYCETLLPVNSQFGRFKNHYNKDDHILYINKKLKDIAAGEHITLIDLYSEFLDDQNKLKESLTFDGLHPNAAGYNVLRRILLTSGYLQD